MHPLMPAPAREVVGGHAVIAAPTEREARLPELLVPLRKEVARIESVLGPQRALELTM